MATRITRSRGSRVQWYTDDQLPPEVAAVAIPREPNSFFAKAARASLAFQHLKELKIRRPRNFLPNATVPLAPRTALAIPAADGKPRRLNGRGKKAALPKTALASLPTEIEIVEAVTRAQPVSMTTQRTAAEWQAVVSSWKALGWSNGKIKGLINDYSEFLKQRRAQKADVFNKKYAPVLAGKVEDKNLRVNYEQLIKALKKAA